MKREAEDQEILTRYLLGELPEVEQLEVEDRAFKDEEFLSRLQDAENDLMDEYARGQLSADERVRFEELFLASPGRRERVELARDLALIAPQSLAPVPLKVPWRLPFMEFLTARPVIGYALAALAVLIVAGGIWVTWQTLKPGSPDIARVPANQQPQPSGDVRPAETGTTPPSADVASTPVPDKPNETRAPRSPAVASFVLFPVTRDSGDQVKQIAVSQQTQTVQFQLELERRESATNFRAELKRSGNKVWVQEKLRARLTQNGGALILSIPAKVLAEGQYEVTLSGASPEGFKNIGFYYFAISRN